ncbi:MAG: YvcK family protein [Anaerolineales bacterium]|nr:YvcK family protein [Anaerolineales bacterium]
MKNKPKARRISIGKELARSLRWFSPGLGVKRWLLTLLAGITFSAVGLGLLLLDIYRTAPETWWLPVIRVISLQALPRLVRVLIFGSIGIGLILAGIIGLNRSLLVPFLRPGRRLVDQVAEYRRREKGPRVVAIGGGHGLATVLRGMKNHTHNLTAVVAVTDDGGSSGELRRSLGILPPGDMRNCLAALSNDEALLTQLFQYRFSGDNQLEGHSFGNLFISALVDITGSFEEAISESGRVLSVHGRVLPATLHNVHLVADVQLPNLPNEVRVTGESKIPKIGGRVRRVWLEPNDATAFPPVIQAILSADMITIGPGSLYTSLLPNVLVPDLLAAIRSSRALKIFICNIATQIGETQAYNCGDHVRSLEESIGSDLIDIIVCNTSYEADLPDGVQWVMLDEELLSKGRVYCADLLDRERPLHHEASKLAQTLIDLFYERTGPLDREIQ